MNSLILNSLPCVVVVLAGIIAPPIRDLTIIIHENGAFALAVAVVFGFALSPRNTKSINNVTVEAI